MWDVRTCRDFIDAGVIFVDFEGFGVDAAWMRDECCWFVSVLVRPIELGWD